MDTEQLLDVLKCDSCKLHFQGTIYMCEAGHSACQTCTRFSNVCRVCKLALKYKNVAVMKIIESCSVECSGCIQSFKISELFDHINSTWTCFLCDQCCMQTSTAPSHFVAVHKLKDFVYKDQACIKFGSEEKTVFCKVMKVFVVFSHKKASRNISVFTTSAKMVNMTYSFGNANFSVNIQPNESRILKCSGSDSSSTSLTILRINI